MQAFALTVFNARCSTVIYQTARSTR